MNRLARAAQNFLLVSAAALAAAKLLTVWPGPTLALLPTTRHGKDKVVQITV